MLNNQAKMAYKKIVVILILSLIGMMGMNRSFAQSISTHDKQQQNNPANRTFAVIPRPKAKPNIPMPTRTINRIGTAIGARNSISIKSTDAGIIHRPPLASTCANCGVINFINSLGQGDGLNAITSGVVAGTIARRIGRNVDTNAGTTNLNEGYDVGITMQDGTQAVITLPDASHFNSGDHIQLIDGVLVPQY